MAREEHEREDLLAEARALVERIEIELADGRHLVIGFRRDGCASLFLNGDPAYHFNTHHELRRAFVEGRLLKAQRRALIALTRHRTADEVQLVRHDLSAEETNRFLADMTARVRDVRAALVASHYKIIGQVPDDVDVLARARAWLEQLPEPISIAARPNAT
jgi:hypothetical protein